MKATRTTESKTIQCPEVEDTLNTFLSPSIHQLSEHPQKWLFTCVVCPSFGWAERTRASEEGKWMELVAVVISRCRCHLLSARLCRNIKILRSTVMWIHTRVVCQTLNQREREREREKDESKSSFWKPQKYYYTSTWEEDYVTSLRSKHFVLVLSHSHTHEHSTDRR